MYFNVETHKQREWGGRGSLQKQKACCQQAEGKQLLLINTNTKVLAQHWPSKIGYIGGWQWRGMYVGLNGEWKEKGCRNMPERIVSKKALRGQGCQNNTRMLK